MYIAINYIFKFIWNALHTWNREPPFFHLNLFLHYTIMCNIIFHYTKKGNSFINSWRKDLRLKKNLILYNQNKERSL